MYIKRDATRQQSGLIFINFRLLLCIPDITCTSKNTQMRHIYDGLSVTSTSSTSVTQIKALLFSTPCPLQIICLSPCIRSLCFRSICALYSSRARCAARLSRSPRGLAQKKYKTRERESIFDQWGCYMRTGFPGNVGYESKSIMTDKKRP